MACVLVDAGKNHAEVWETMTSCGLTVPLLFSEWCGLVTTSSPKGYCSEVTLHTEREWYEQKATRSKARRGELHETRSSVLSVVLPDGL